MKYLKILVMLIAGFWLAVPAAAQVLELTLEKARELALVNNPQIKLANEALKKSDAQVTETRAGLLPTVSAFTSYQKYWEIPTVIFNDMAFKMGSENTMVAGFNFQQPLFVGGAIWSGYQISQNVRNITRSQFQATRQATLLEVTNAYNSVLFARSVMGVMQQSLAAAEKNLEQVRKFRATGMSSDFDVLRAEVQLATYKPQLVSAENGAHLAVSNLLRIIGLGDTELVIISEELTYLPNEYSNQNFQTLVAMALTNRPESKMLIEQHSIAQRQLSLARASLMPSLVFGTSYQFIVQIVQLIAICLNK